MAETSESRAWFTEEVATFGDRLTAAREAAGQSQTELATRLGVREKTFAAWENDVSEPRGNRLQMVAGMLNVSMRWLLTGVGEDLGPPGTTPALTHPAKAALADLARIRAEIGRLSAEMERTENGLRALLQTEDQGA